MDPNKGKKLRINCNMGISLAKLLLDGRALRCSQLFFPFLLYEEMQLTI